MALDENLDENYHLEELGGSGYEIVEGESDIIGWDVKNEQGQKIGEVDDLLFDKQQRKVRYIIVDLDDNDLELENDKKVLIPIGIANLYDADEDMDDSRVEDETDTLASRDSEYAGVNDITGDNEDEMTTEGHDPDHESGVYDPSEDGSVVIVPVTLEQLKALPAYEKDKVTPETESMIKSIFEGAAATAVLDYDKNKFYDHDHFNENKFYDKSAATTSSLPVIEENLEVGKEEVETGRARVTSRIVERPVEESINLREEHVTVERTPVDRPVSAADLDAFKEEEFELTEHAEVPIVSKEARVVEEVSLHKEAEEKEETIRDTLRNTEVDTERIDPKKTDLL